MNDTIARDYPDFFVEHPTLNYGLLIFVGAGIVCGIIGNSMVIISCVVDRQLRTPANVFIVHLAVTDLGISAISHPFSVAGLIDGHRIYEYGNMDLCRVVATFCFVFCLSSIAGMMVISINRMVSVVWPHKYKTLFTMRNCYRTVAGLWLYPVLLHLPTFFGWGHDWYDPKAMICSPDRSRSPSYILVVGGFAIITPVVIIFVCYLKLFWTVHRSKQKVQDRGGVATVSNPGRQPMKPRKTQERETRLAKTLFTIFIVFCVLWMPYGFLLLLDVLRGDLVPKAVHAIAVQMAHGNSCGINALVYYVTQHRFRRDFNLLLTCRAHHLNTYEVGMSASFGDGRSNTLSMSHVTKQRGPPGIGHQ